MFRPGRDKGIATPIPLGFAALATTTFLMGVALIFQTHAAWGPYFLQAIFLGGLAELLAGMWSFAYGDPMAATAFSFLGAFYMAWGFGGLPVAGLHAVATASLFSAGLVFVVTGVVTLYMWIAAFNESAAFNATMLFLWVSFVLAGITLFSDVAVIGVIAGICAIIAGLIAAYASFAELYNASTMREVVPLGEPEEMRTRSMHEEQDRLRRLHAPNGMHDVGSHA
ncbi:MAG TPA: acetate uptake transporter [Candidatus Binataceae bacterium]|nr:acetate uptake transporter [Candidatus Binataceae bacterium]